jgi:DNA-binding transcriptional regulator GbsR (MarR family)
MDLSPTVKKLALHWGQMGTRWGINRSVAQIYALLFFSPDPLPADEIADILSLARSNVSTSIRDLQGWGVVKVVHKIGDRRDHYEALEDVWESFQRIAAARRRRELDPTLSVLRESLAELEKGKGAQDAYARGRVSRMLEFVEAVVAWQQEADRLSPAALRKLARMATKIRKLVRAVGGES